MKRKPDSKDKSFVLPLASALLAGSAVVGSAFLGSAALASPVAVGLASPPALSAFVSLNGASGFVAAGTSDPAKLVRTAQTYDAYYCYYYGYDCCDPNTAEGRDACCYYYGTYCNSSSSLGGPAKPEDDYSPAGFAGTGAARPKAPSANPLL